MLEPVKAGLMKNAYADPYARQAHRDKGLEYKDSIVHLLIDGEHSGTGVLVGDGSCVLLTFHQFNNAGATSRPMNKLVQISTGENYLTDPGEIIEIVDFVPHPLATAASNVKVDLVVAKAAQKPIGAKPMALAEAAPQVGDVLDLAGFGIPATPATGLMSPTGELLGGRTPVHSLSTLAGGVIVTKFQTISSLPLNFGGTIHLSGGLLAYPSDAYSNNNPNSGKLVGIEFGGTNPDNNQNTYSTNIPNNRTWITEQLAVLNALPVILMPSLSMQILDGKDIKLLVEENPVKQSGGQWMLERSTDLSLDSWQQVPSNLQESLSHDGFLVLPLDETKSFFRLSWRPGS